MNIIKKLIQFLSGKKTYLCGLALIIIGVIQKDEKLILAGLSLMSVKAAIKKIEPKVAEPNANQ